MFFISASLDTQLLLELLQPAHSNGRTRRTHVLDLKHTDSRPDLVGLRNAGVQNFIVDIGADLLNIFFDQVECWYILGSILQYLQILYFCHSFDPKNNASYFQFILGNEIGHCT